jgi:hypothetical protein
MFRAPVQPGRLSPLAGKHGTAAGFPSPRADGRGGEGSGVGGDQ